MNTDTITNLLKLICSAIDDIGIPIEGKRMFERSLKRNMAEAQKIYINSHEAYRVLDTKWFLGYLCHSMSIPGLCRYTLEEESWKWAKRIYVRNLAADVKIYADMWADGISDLEEMALRNFYRMLLMVMQEAIKPLKRGYLLPVTYKIMCGIREEDRSSGTYRGRQADDEVQAVMMAAGNLELREKADLFLGAKREYGDWDSWLEAVVSGYQPAEDGQWRMIETLYRCAVDCKAKVLADLLRQFFIRTDTLWLLVTREIARMAAGDNRWWVLCSLMKMEDEWCLGKEYRDKRLDVHQIKACLKAIITGRIYQQCWKGDIFGSGPYYRTLVEYYRERTRLSVWEYEWVDCEISMADGKSAYLAALTDRERYLSLVRELLEAGMQDDWTKIKLRDYPWELLKRRPDLKAVARDFYLNRDDLSMRRWMDCLAGEQWEHYASYNIYEWLARHYRKQIPAEIELWIRQYYERHINNVDFQKAIIWKTDSSMIYHGELAEMITLFVDRFGYEMPKEKAKELLFWSSYLGRRQKGWLPARYLTDEEIRVQVIENMLSGELKGDVMRWHIRYCIDYHIKECAPIILKAARNPVRNVWVRKDALEYACGLMGVREVCSSLLPGLKGELFFFVVEFFRDTEDRELADIVWNYGEEYPSQKLRSDICLTFMQDRKGVESLRRHLQRRNGIPMEPVVPGPAEAIRSIRSVELAGELEKLLCAAWKTGFRDDPDDSLLDAAAEALLKIAHCGGEGYEQVMRIFGRLMVKYRKEDDKAAVIRRWIRESTQGAD